MAVLSDNLLIITILAYCAAMVCHTAEYAFGSRTARAGRVAAVAAATVPGRGSVLTAEREEESPVRERSPRRLPAWVPTGVAGRLAVGTLGIAALTHTAAVVTRGLAAERLPWGNMYEFLLTATLVGVATWFAVLRRHPNVRLLGLFVALVNLALLGVAGMVVYVPVGPLVAALDSAWFVIHIAAMVLATGAFLVGFVTATMHLIRVGHDRGRRGFPFPLAARMPAADTLDRLTFRLHAFGFPIWTVGALIVGPIWAEAAWGRYWNWDPKEIWALVSWIVYAAYLHARATPSMRRTTAAWLAVVGWLTMMMNLFGVNFFFEGLHSYAS